MVVFSAIPLVLRCLTRAPFPRPCGRFAVALPSVPRRGEVAEERGKSGSEAQFGALEALGLLGHDVAHHTLDIGHEGRGGEFDG